jgi:hypothetical protein
MSEQGSRFYSVGARAPIFRGRASTTAQANHTVCWHITVYKYFPCFLQSWIYFLLIFVRIITLNWNFSLLLVGWDWVPCTAATSGQLYQPQMIGEGYCGAIGGMNIGRGNRSTRRKPSPAPLCPPQISLDQTQDRTRAAELGSQQLTAWAMARP